MPRLASRRARRRARHSAGARPPLRRAEVGPRQVGDELLATPADQRILRPQRRCARAWAAWAGTATPTACPCWSLTSLKWSKSISRIAPSQRSQSSVSRSPSARQESGGRRAGGRVVGGQFGGAQCVLQLQVHLGWFVSLVAHPGVEGGDVPQEGRQSGAAVATPPCGGSGTRRVQDHGVDGPPTMIARCWGRRSSRRGRPRRSGTTTLATILLPEHRGEHDAALQGHQCHQPGGGGGVLNTGRCRRRRSPSMTARNNADRPATPSSPASSPAAHDHTVGGDGTRWRSSRREDSHGGRGAYGMKMAATTTVAGSSDEDHPVALRRTASHRHRDQLVRDPRQLGGGVAGATPLPAGRGASRCRPRHMPALLAQRATISDCVSRHPRQMITMASDICPACGGTSGCSSAWRALAKWVWRSSSSQ